MNSSVCLIWRLRNNIFSENRYEILAERENRMDLKEFFQQNPRAALGFSGGVDSAFLLAMAVKYKAQVQPYFIKTAFQPEFELHDARELTRRLGVELTVIEHDILSSRQVAENPENRCYYCKKTLFGLLKEKALKDGYTMLLDGTNASDDFSDRPGMQAIRELEVRSPLRECGLTKTEIRRLSKEEGLFTWNKPSYACLATRIPAGTVLTEPELQKIEKAEGKLFSLGFMDFRIRLFHGAARIQLPAEQMAKMTEIREEIYRELKPYFKAVLLDLETRKSV